MAPRTSATNLSFGGKGVEKEVVVTEKMVNEKKKPVPVKRSSVAETTVGKPTRLEVNLVNLKLPLTTVVKRSRPREPREQEEPAAKRHRIKDAGREITVDCSINRPRCQVCKLNMSTPEALRYHNMMTHSSLQITAVSPVKEEPRSVLTSPGRRVVRVKVQREVVEVVEVLTGAKMVEPGQEEMIGEQSSESPKKIVTGKVPNSKATKRGYKRTASRDTNETCVGTKEKKTEKVMPEASPPPGQPEAEPLAGLLTRTLAHLAVIDRANVFRDPVDLAKVPDYLTCVARPMDFYTMAGKVAEGGYASIDAFEVDFRLVVANCQAYNVETTSFWRAARRMGNLGGKVLHMAREGRLGLVGEAGEEASKHNKKPRNTSVKPKKRKSKSRGEENLETDQVAKKKSEKTLLVCEASPGDSGVSTTAPDSDNSAGSEFAVPGSVPRRKSSRPSGPKRPEITGPMEGEFTGRRQSERRYGGEKPFMCNHCPLTFSNLAAKVGHERTHQEKPLECPWCEMRFEGELGLRRHTRIHTRQLDTTNTATNTSSGATSTSSGISTGAEEGAGPSS